MVLPKGRKEFTLVAPNTTVLSPSSQRFEVGQIVYCLEWQGDMPRIVTGEIVAMDGKALVLAEADGSLFNARRCAPQNAAYLEPREALHAEMEWMRWFAPYDGSRDSSAAIRRAKRSAALMELWKQTLPQARKSVAQPVVAAA
jgi:hypothetical protein